MSHHYGRRLLGGIAGAAFLLGPQAEAASSLRFTGPTAADYDFGRVSIPIDAPPRPADVGQGDFTFEFWMKADPGTNDTTACSTANISWINGSIMFDRDIDGPGDYGDWGIALMNGRIGFGVSQGNGGGTACGSTNLASSTWRHVAVTRRASDGALQIWVDGVLDGSGFGASGDVSYRDDRATNRFYDPTLVWGAEKHGYSGYSGFTGLVDEVRMSNVRRYTVAFTRPTQPFVADAATVALYRLDEGAGTIASDSSGAAGGPSHGTLREGGSPVGPLWSTDTPFDAIFRSGFEA
jgi:hypothetical protein